MDYRNPPPLYRVVTIGDSSVGKTSIINRLIHQNFNPLEQTTVGAMFVVYSEDVDNNKIEMQIWDTAGQEKFRALGPIYYRNSAVGIVVFDFTSKQSFSHIDMWIENFSKYAGGEALIVAAANKSDLIEDREISDEIIKEWSESRSIKCFSISAKTGSGIKEMFHYIAEELSKNSSIRVPIVTPSPINQPSEDKSNGCSC